LEGYIIKNILTRRGSNWDCPGKLELLWGFPN